jgi:hypothetical protein
MEKENLSVKNDASDERTTYLNYLTEFLKENHEQEDIFYHTNCNIKEMINRYDPSCGKSFEETLDDFFTDETTITKYYFTKFSDYIYYDRNLDEDVSNAFKNTESFSRDLKEAGIDGIEWNYREAVSNFDILFWVHVNCNDCENLDAKFKARVFVNANVADIGKFVDKMNSDEGFLQLSKDTLFKLERGTDVSAYHFDKDIAIPMNMIDYVEYDKTNSIRQRTIGEYTALDVDKAFTTEQPLLKQEDFRQTLKEGIVEIVNDPIEHRWWQSFSAAMKEIRAEIKNNAQGQKQEQSRGR